ncbi:MAG: hypothetical protein IKZ84_14370, partial [Victivallales bacterium]|nr:hypothetical protein [Victivallales bacterium]
RLTPTGGVMQWRAAPALKSGRPCVLKNCMRSPFLFYRQLRALQALASGFVCVLGTSYYQRRDADGTSHSQRRDADDTSYFFRISMKAAEPGSDFFRW